MQWFTLFISHTNSPCNVKPSHGVIDVVSFPM